MSSTLEGNAVAEWKAGWPVVMASGLGMALSTIHVYSTGVFMAPLEQEFGWSRAEISSGLTITAMIGVLSAPFVGLAIDRIGPRRIGVYGGALFCAMVGLLSAAGSSIWTWWALWLLLAISATAIKPTIWTAAVSSLFARGRGLALSVMLCGTGLGSSVTPILCNYLIAHYGWRVAYIGLAAFWGVAVIPILFFFLTSALDRHRRSAGAGERVPLAALTGVTAREGLRSARFVKLAVGAFLISLVAVSLVVNIVPILTSMHLTKDRAAGIAGLVGIASVAGRLTAGVLLDRWNGNIIAAISVTLPIIFCALLLAAPGNIAASIVGAIVLGLSLGAELDAVAYLATRHFGMRSFGVLFGTISGLLALSVGLGPLFTSHVFDVTRSYVLVLWLYMPLCLIASTLFLWLGPYPDFTAADATASRARGRQSS